MNDTHSIPAGDEPEPVTSDDYDEAIVTVMERPSESPLTLAEVRQLARVLRAGQALTSARIAPAKTHDLAVHTVREGIRIVVDDEVDDWRLHLPPDAAKVLGQMLTLLTPAQVAILAAELTGDTL